jgi:hypothetical protein
VCIQFQARREDKKFLATKQHEEEHEAKQLICLFVPDV